MSSFGQLISCYESNAIKFSVAHLLVQNPMNRMLKKNIYYELQLLTKRKKGRGNCSNKLETASGGKQNKS